MNDVDGVGEAGAVVDVAPGYLRNYLVPRKLAQAATDAAVAEARRRLEAREKAQRAQTERSQETVTLLNKTVLTIQHEAGEDGRLFGSVTSQEIVRAIRDARGINVDKKKVLLSEPIKQLGTHMVEIDVAPDVKASVKTIIVEKTGKSQ